MRPACFVLFAVGAAAGCAHRPLEVSECELVGDCDLGAADFALGADLALFSSFPFAIFDFDTGAKTPMIDYCGAMIGLSSQPILACDPGRASDQVTPPALRIYLSSDSDTGTYHARTQGVCLNGELDLRFDAYYDTENGPPLHARSGTVQVTSISPAQTIIAGSYDFVVADEQGASPTHLSGSFTAPECAEP